MRSSSREEIVEVLDALEADYKRALDLTFDVLTTPERLRVLERWEQMRRWQPAVEHALINQLAEQADPTELGGKLPAALANRLRISRAEASRRIHEAADLGERGLSNGEPLPPALPATAEAQRNGDTRRRSCRGHPRLLSTGCPTSSTSRPAHKAEAQLARLGGEHRPDELAKLADKLTDCLNPDGDFSDVDRARRRGITIGKQDLDGMSPISGYLTPEARATFDAVFAKLAAPGMCNSADETPCVGGTPSQAAIQGDTRSLAQRNHDALLAAGPRAYCPPVSSVSTTGCPPASSSPPHCRNWKPAPAKRSPAAGTLLPMSDVIRLAGHAHHYLAIFDKGKALALYHTKRLASPAQRIVLYAKDRGCSFPGCNVPGYLCEVHHRDPYATNPVTDINDLTFACGPNHKLAEQGWTTRKNRAATPNGSRHRTWTMGNPGSTPTTTPKNCCGTTKTTRCRQQARSTASRARSRR